MKKSSETQSSEKMIYVILNTPLSLQFDSKD